MEGMIQFIRFKYGFVGEKTQRNYDFVDFRNFIISFNGKNVFRIEK